MQLAEIDPRSNGNSRSARPAARIFAARPAMTAPWRNKSRAAERVTSAWLTTLTYSLAKSQRLANFGSLDNLRRLKNPLRSGEHDVDRLWESRISGVVSSGGSISCASFGSSRPIPAFWFRLGSGGEQLLDDFGAGRFAHSW